MSDVDPSSSISFFKLQQKQCRASATAQQDTQRLAHFSTERRLQNLPSTSQPLSTKERDRIYHECKRSLDAGFHVLLLGLGSKYQLVQDLSKSVLLRYTTVTIDGYSNAFSMRYLLTSISERILHYQPRHRQLDQQVQDLVREFTERANTHIYLVIHNLDGPRFRNPKVQNVFSRLGQCRYIHILATVDHIRTRLLWDSVAVSSLSFHTIPVHTLQSYVNESWNPTLSKRKSKRTEQTDGETIRKQASSIDKILPCLTARQKDYLSNLAFSQLNHSESGLNFQDWSDVCNVTSDRDFRQIIQELKFHQIIEEVPDPDTAVIYYNIPFSKETIQEKLLGHLSI